jgi:hypothetical protein
MVDARDERGEVGSKLDAKPKFGLSSAFPSGECSKADPCPCSQCGGDRDQPSKTVRARLSALVKRRGSNNTRMAQGPAKKAATFYWIRKGQRYANEGHESPRAAVTTRHIPPSVEVICSARPQLPRDAFGVAAEQVPGELCELARKITCTSQAINRYGLQNQCHLHS